YREYEPIAAKYHVPIVVTGFEPLDLLHGTLMLVDMLEDGRIGVENQYARAVQRDGNTLAQDLVTQVFMPGERKWRGIGEIPASGLSLRPEYATHDAELRFAVGTITADEPAECISGAIMQGHSRPHECPA